VAASSPFRFVGCIELLENLGVKAQDERELLEFLRQVPAASVFYHTCGAFLRHRIFVGPYANDFATWTAVHLGDRVLGERLAVVDPFDFADLEQLREELVSIVSDHLGHLRVPPRVDDGEPFHFVQSHVVEVPTGLEARTLAEFRDRLAEVEASAIHYHTVLARARLGRGAGDFAGWLRGSLGRDDLAAAVERTDPYLSSLERVRSRLLDVLDAALDAGPAAGGGEPAGPA
jgi:Family of unknown function (DUF5752)